jgi:hypothetical protein
MYPGLIAKADVVGFDLYPLQEFCRPDLLPAVFDMQRELVARAAGKPTFQWIEEREMKCAQPEAAVNAQTIRLESWLAIAGGAHGLAFFPPDWSASTGRVIGDIAARIRQLEPALLQPPLSAGIATSSNDVRASMRELNGALYAIVVNAGVVAANVVLSADGIGDRRFDALDSPRSVAGRDNALSLHLPPRTVRIYVAAPRS